MKKSIVLFFLLPIVNVVVAKKESLQIKFLMDEITKTAKDSWQIRFLTEEIEKTDAKMDQEQQRGIVAKGHLSDTPQMKIYNQARLDRSRECAFDHNSLSCNECIKALEDALAKLQQTEQYKKEYLPSITRRDYLAVKKNGLKLMRNFATFQSDKHGSERCAMIAAVKSMELVHDMPSTVSLEFTNDLGTTQDEVKRELWELVHQLYPGITEKMRDQSEDEAKKELREFVSQIYPNIQQRRNEHIMEEKTKEIESIMSEYR